MDLEQTTCVDEGRRGFNRLQHFVLSRYVWKNVAPINYHAFVTITMSFFTRYSKCLRTGESYAPNATKSLHFIEKFCNKLFSRIIATWLLFKCTWRNACKRSIVCENDFSKYPKLHLYRVVLTCVGLEV